MSQIKHFGLAAVVALVAGAGIVLAQSGHGGHGQHGAGANPYAAFKDRQIKALSAEQMAELRDGRGMGLALAAEMNGYPGPMHVLQLADALSLSVEQRTRLDGLFSTMKSEALAIGEQIIKVEGELDKQFAARSITAESLDQLTKQIADSQGRLRATHLRYHLETVVILSPTQIAKYNAARGYTP